MVEPPDKPLQDTTTETLSKEVSADNIPEVKDEPVDTNVQAITKLQDITPQTPSVELPDTTKKLDCCFATWYTVKLGQWAPTPNSCTANRNQTL